MRREQKNALPERTLGRLGVWRCRRMGRLLLRITPPLPLYAALRLLQNYLKQLGTPGSVCANEECASSQDAQLILTAQMLCMPQSALIIDDVILGCNVTSASKFSAIIGSF